MTNVERRRKQRNSRSQCWNSPGFVRSKYGSLDWSQTGLQDPLDNFYEWISLFSAAMLGYWHAGNVPCIYHFLYSLQDVLLGTELKWNDYHSNDCLTPHKWIAFLGD